MYLKKNGKRISKMRYTRNISVLAVPRRTELEADHNVSALGRDFSLQREIGFSETQFHSLESTHALETCCEPGGRCYSSNAGLSLSHAANPVGSWSST
jgi:hypothetical protein